MTVGTLPHWLTISQASEHTGLSEWTIRQQIANGALKARRIGRCVRVLDEELARWMRGENQEASS